MAARLSAARLLSVKDLLFLSNGAGEDAIADRVIGHLPDYCEPEVMPLVGLGVGYRPELARVGPRRVFPSQGLINESLLLLLKDLASGLLRHHYEQWRFLRLASAQDRWRLTVAVGDLFPVIMAAAAGLRPLLFIGTAKSVWHHPYSWLERLILRRACTQVLTRDEPTAECLRAAGVQATWVGNAMMDELRPQGVAIDCPLVIFPGSREGAYQDFSMLFEAYKELCRRGDAPAASVALADSIDESRLAQSAGLKLESSGEATGVVGRLLGQGHPPLLLCRRVLGDQLRDARVALGQAGTANEQAAGAGVPVVSFAEGAESRLGWYRGRQKGLLGDAVRVTEPHPGTLAAELRSLFDDEKERCRRAQIGRQRLGPPGGAERMASTIAAHLCKL